MSDEKTGVKPYLLFSGVTISNVSLGSSVAVLLTSTLCHSINPYRNQWAPICILSYERAVYLIRPPHSVDATFGRVVPYSGDIVSSFYTLIPLGISCFEYFL